MNSHEILISGFKFKNWNDDEIISKDEEKNKEEIDYNEKLKWRSAARTLDAKIRNLSCKCVNVYFDLRRENLRNLILNKMKSKNWEF